jgi:hypothetical protein
MQYTRVYGIICVNMQHIGSLQQVLKSIIQVGTSFANLFQETGFVISGSGMSLNDAWGMIGQLWQINDKLGDRCAGNRIKVR